MRFISLQPAFSLSIRILPSRSQKRHRRTTLIKTPLISHSQLIQYPLMPSPIIADFTNEDGSDNLKETIEANYKQVKQEVLSLVASEIDRIKNDPDLKHLIKE